MAFLLAFPRLYGTSIIAYESVMYPVGRLVAIVNETQNVVGDIVECGANLCGTSCCIAVHLKKSKMNKKIFALDSFEGFQKKELVEEKRAGSTTIESDSFKYNSIAYVTKKIQALELQDYVIPIKGWFKDTLPTMQGPFSFALIDCALEKSAEECLQHIWPLLSKGGAMVIDDYEHTKFRGIKKAVDKFIENRAGEISCLHRDNRFEIWK